VIQLVTALATGCVVSASGTWSLAPSAEILLGDPVAHVVMVPSTDDHLTMTVPRGAPACVTIGKDGRRAEIGWRDRPVAGGDTVHVRLAIPSGRQVVLRLGGGTVAAHGLSATLALTTVSADLRATDVRADLSVRSVEGDIWVDTADAPVRARTTRGVVRVMNAANLVTIATVDGAIHVSGPVTGGRIESWSGAIDVTLPPVRGAVPLEVTTYSSDVVVHQDPARRRRIRARSEGGRVIAARPGTLGAEVVLPGTPLGGDINVLTKTGTIHLREEMP
jgi:hypothetical protein